MSETMEERAARRAAAIEKRTQTARDKRAARERLAAEARRATQNAQRGALVSAGARLSDLDPRPTSEALVDTLQGPSPEVFDPIYTAEEAPLGNLPATTGYEPPELQKMLELDTGNRVDTVEDDLEDFLYHYAATGMWNQSAYKVGRTGPSFRKLAKENPCVNALIAEAYQDFRERLEREMLRRGVEGVVQPVYGKEGLVGYTRVYSDKMLEMALRAASPEKYREQAGPQVPTDVKFGVLVVPGIVMSPEEWEERHGEAARGLPTPMSPSEPGPAIDERRVPLPKITRPVVVRG